MSRFVGAYKNSGTECKKQNKVIALVGPTGVGKTTTIAKLALIAKIIHKLDVGLMSIDTYRLGAVDQLKSFADVSHTDFLVAYEPGEIPALMKNLQRRILFLSIPLEGIIKMMYNFNQI